MHIKRYRRGLKTCSQAKTSKSGREYFSSFFSDASERRVWLSAESKRVASTFGPFRLYRFKFKISRWFRIFRTFDNLIMLFASRFNSYAIGVRYYLHYKMESFWCQGFFQKFRFQKWVIFNFLKNELNNNEKFCSWVKTRVSFEINLTVIWTHESMPTTFELNARQQKLSFSSNSLQNPWRQLA